MLIDLDKCRCNWAFDIRGYTFTSEEWEIIQDYIISHERFIEKVFIKDSSALNYTIRAEILPKIVT